MNSPAPAASISMGLVADFITFEFLGKLSKVDRDQSKLRIESVVDAMNVELRTVAGKAF